MKRIERIRAYEAEISDIYKKIRRLQENCKHKNVKEKTWTNFGNYDKTLDCSGSNFTCLDCDKRWIESKPRDW